MSFRFYLREFASRYARQTALFIVTVLCLSSCSLNPPPDKVSVRGDPYPAEAAPAAAPAPRPAPPPTPIVVGADVEHPAAAIGSKGEGSGAPKDKPNTAKPGSIPQFPWPPPKASAEETIPAKWLRTETTTTLGDVAEKLEKALKLADYEQWSYYTVPRGFALATHLEKIEADGTPLPGADRWKIGTPTLANLSLLAFIKALAGAPAGDYRAIIFVVTDAQWVQTAAVPVEGQIAGWAGGGANALPATLGAMRFSEAYRAQALVYQFRKRGTKQAEYVLPSRVSGETHLEKGGIWKPLSIL
jgi:hypothetical protein